MVLLILQEAISGLFKEQYGCTPAAYRRNPIPIRLQIAKRFGY